MAALRPDSLAFEKLDAEIRRRDAHRLLPLGLQMHFDAPGVVIDPGDVSELAQVKIGVEFAINAGQQVEIKSGSHSQFVVVGPEQLCAGLFQIGPEKK